MNKILLDNIKINVDDMAVNKFISAASSDIGKEFMYDGLSNQEILDFHPDDKVYQFYNSTINVYAESLKLIRTNIGYTLNVYHYSEKEFNFGSASPLMTGKIEQILKDKNVRIRAFLYGGRYKKVVVNDDDSESVKSFRDPYKILVAIVEEQPDKKQVEYVPAIVDRVKKGQRYYCLNCQANLVGERTCPNCGQTITYPEETNQSNFAKAANGLEKAGNSMSNFGKNMTLGCTIPILLLILIGAFLL